MEFAFDEPLLRMRELGRSAGYRYAAPSAQLRDNGAIWDERLFTSLARAGVAHAAIPLAYGGLGANVLETVAVLEGFGEGSGDTGLSLAVAVHGMLCALPIALLGTPQQRDRYLGAMASGTWLGALALAELDGGATASGHDVTATRFLDGWILEGEKADVINAPNAHHFLITARTSSDRRTAFVVDRDTAGLSVAPDPAQTAVRTCRMSRVKFSDCRVGPQAVLGTPGNAAARLVPLLAALDRTCLLAPWLGILREVVRLGRETAARRFVLSRPLAHSQSVRAALVDGQTLVEAASGLLYRAAWQLDRSEPASRRDAAAAKLFLGRAVRDVTRTVAELCGTAADGLVRRAYRDSLLLTASGGGVEVLNVVIAGPAPSRTA